MTDEHAADDGSIHRFWAFIVRRRRERLPEFDLEDLEQLRAAVAEFDHEETA